MTNSPDGWSRGGRDEQNRPGYSGYSDPAYASQAPYGSPYQPPPPPRPTERLPAYSPYGGYDPYATGQYPPPYQQGGGSEPPPEGPKSPRWLWIVAGVAVVLVIGLVIALVIVNSSRQDSVSAPLPPMPEPSFTQSPTTNPRAPTTRPSTPVLPVPTLPTFPSAPTTEPTVPGATDTVVYTIEGTGRAINVTYVDTGGLLQTEFNVMLPWSKEVSLPQPGETSASISIINVGREVTCSISVNGEQLDVRTGAGLTICAPAG